MFHYTQEVIRNNLCRDKSILIFLMLQVGFEYKTSYCEWIALLLLSLLF